MTEKGAPTTVLIIDDEPTILEVTSTMLEALGYSVLIAASGLEAIEVLNRHIDKIGVVILDLAMPEMSGEETFDALRAVSSDVPILVSSGYRRQEAERRFAAKGIAGFLQKPYHLDTLEETLLPLCAGP